MMGSGKSVVGRALGTRLRRRFVDTDDIVTRRMGCSIAEFWGSHGEEAFRDMEAAAVLEIAAGPARVVATGGGAVLDAANVAAMRRTGMVVWLQASPETLRTRVRHGVPRPLLHDADPGEKLAAILAERSAAYEAAAHASVATDELSVDTVAERIEELWNAL